MPKTIIDDNFIEKWQQEYDKKEGDDQRYDTIKLKVSEELNKNEIISEDTFISILDWKSPRVKGIIKKDDFEYYAKGIRKAIKSSDGKIEILDELRGIGIPVASTILHFIYPGIFPIVDFRTVEVLQNAGNLDESKRYYNYRDSLVGYNSFCQAIKTIACHHPKYCLRQIDKALFAYHKYELKSKMHYVGKARCE